MMKKLLYLLAIGLTIGLSQSELKAQSCQAMFQYFPNGLTVQFQDSSWFVGNNYQTFWDFGDGLGSDTGAFPRYTYTRPGTYSVCLYMYTTICADTICTSITVTAPPSSCNANFTVTKDTNSTTGVLLLNNSSNLTTHSYFWDFGDNSTSTMRNPTHQYANFGSYRVCLTVMDSTQNCTATFCDTVGMDSLGNLKAAGFSMRVQDPVIVGLEDQNSTLESIKFYPNPVINELNIDFTSIERDGLQIQLRDLTGRLLVEKRNETINNLERIDLSSFQQGIYIININHGQLTKTVKIIKSK